jgi:hypothetical protein
MSFCLEAMKQSKQEARDDHPSPMVGAVLVFPDGEVEGAYRGDSTEVLSQLNDEEIAGLDFVKTRGEVSRKEYEDHFNFNTLNGQCVASSHC